MSEATNALKSAAKIAEEILKKSKRLAPEAKAIEEIAKAPSLKGAAEAFELATKRPDFGTYSKLEEIIQQKMPNKASPEQIRAIIKDAKPDEVAFTGLEDLLSGKALDDSAKSSQKKAFEEWQDKGAKAWETFSDNGDESAFKTAVEKHKLERPSLAVPEKKSSLTKDEVLKQVRENQPKLNEITLGSVKADQQLMMGMEDNLDKLQKIRDLASEKLNSSSENLVSKLVKEHGFSEKRAKDLVSQSKWAKDDQMVRGGDIYTLYRTALPEGSSLNIDDFVELLKQDRKAGRELTSAVREYNTKSTEAARGTNTKYQKYSLEGGKNYKETLIQNPDPGFTRRQYKSGHWDKPDVLAHVRSQEFTDTQGKKLFNIEEIQSDWHQQGRKSGYSSKDTQKNLLAKDKEVSDFGKETTAMTKKFEAQQGKILKLIGQSDSLTGNKRANIYQIITDPDFKLNDLGKVGTQGGREAIDIVKSEEMAKELSAFQKLSAEKEAVFSKWGQIRSEQDALLRASETPDAPFKKTWHELALKKSLKDAVDSGADRMSWTPGAEQADRYSLAKTINTITYQPSEGRLIAVSTDGKRVLDQKGIPVEKLEEYIGKDPARKIAEGKPNSEGFIDLENADLKMGGEGMKGFYDQIIPSYLKKLSKQFDAPMGETIINTGGRELKVPYIELSEKLKTQIKTKGMPLFATAAAIGFGTSSNEASASEGNMGQKKKALSWDEIPPQPGDLEPQEQQAQGAMSWDEIPPQPGDLEEEPSALKQFGAKALGKVAEAAEWFDARTGAPSRKAIGVLQEDFTDVPGAWEAAKQQYGAPTQLAPTGKQLSIRAGVPTTSLSEVAPGMFSDTGEEWLKFRKGGFADVSPAGVTGLVTDITADPTNLIPVGKLLKGGKAATQELVGFIRGVGKELPEAARVAKVASQMASEPGVYQTVKNAVQDTAKSVEKLVKPGISPTWEHYRGVAVKHGIDPAILQGGALEHGANTLITRSRQKLAQGIGGETFRNKYMQGLSSIYDATKKVVNKIGDGAEPLARTDAGEVIAQEFKNTQKNFFQKMDITYNTVLSQLPPNAPIPTMALKAYKQSIDPVVTQLIERSKNKFLNPTVRAQAKALAADLKAAGKANGTMQELREGMTQLKDAFENSYLAKDMPLEIRTMRELYKKSSEAFIDGTEDYLGKEVSSALRDNNKAMTEWFRKTERLDDILSGGKSGEEVFRKTIENADSNMLRDMRVIFDQNPGVLKRAKAAFIDGLMKVDEDGMFSFARFNNKIRDPKSKMILKELFTPEEVTELLELTKMGEEMGPQILNPSRTAEFLGLELSPKNIAGEAAQRSIIDILEKQARSRGVGKAAEVIPEAVQEPGLVKEFGNQLKYGGAFAAGAEGLGEMLQDPKTIAAKEIMRQSGRMQEQPQDMDVPLDYMPQLEKDIMSRGKMSNTEKAQLLYRAKKEGKINLDALNRIQEGR